jgi:hypothetical protein
MKALKKRFWHSQMASGDHMKKGVLGKWFSLIFLVTLFLAFSASAKDIPDAPQPAGTDNGFWEYCYISGATPDCVWEEYSDVAELPEADLKDIYSDMDVVTEDLKWAVEVPKLRYVLDPDPAMFVREGSLEQNSHDAWSSLIPWNDDAGESYYDHFKEDCFTECTIDEIDEGCFDPDPSATAKLDKTCIEVDILQRRDCSEMADWDQHFCEGASLVGANAEKIVFGIGTAGDGGCQVMLPEQGDMTPEQEQFLQDLMAFLGGSEEETIALIEELLVPGRDWYPSDLHPSPEETGHFSTEFTGSSEIGRCCGNDPEDAGAIAKNDVDAGSYPNGYICYDERVKTDDGDFRWVWARESESFKILSFNRLGKQFDAVSNSNNWFVCDTGKNAAKLDGLYNLVGKDGVEDQDAATWDAKLNKWKSGILLREYEFLPVPGDDLAHGTDQFSPPGQGAGDGTSFSGGGADLGGEAEDGIIDEEIFSTAEYVVEGITEIRACDQDGDGYDGPVTEQCPQPNEPEDCNDDSSRDAAGGHPCKIIDEAGLEGEETECTGEPGLARMMHPGRLNYCVYSTNEEAYVNFRLDCDPDFSPCIPDPTPDDPESFYINPDATDVAPRFMCHNTDTRGEFAECCSWDLTYCFNPEKGRRTGSAIHTLREFDRRYASIIGDDENKRAESEKKNFVLLYGVNEAPPMDQIDSVAPDATYQIALFSVNNDLNITEWVEYKNLEFYIWFTANYEVEIWLGDFVGTPGEHSLTDSAYYVYPFKATITDYVVNGAELRKWLHVVIPMRDIMDPDSPFSPDVILFVSNVRQLTRIGSTVTMPEVTGTYSNIVGIDKIFLRPKNIHLMDNPDLPQSDSLDSGDINYYCSGTWPPRWISDLDDNRQIGLDTGGIPQLAGRDACESIPSYSWTGTMCCGDDTGANTRSGRIGPATAREAEFFNDTASGCWGGNVLADDSRIMQVRYNMSYYGYTGQVRQSCKNASCVYDLPPVPNVVITNSYPDHYDLAFVNGGYTPIGVGSLSPDEDSYLVAENVPMQVLYYDGDFWSCNEARFIRNLKNSITDRDLIPDDNQLNSPTQDDDYSEDVRSCTMKGSYFCDHADGEDTGWNDETITAYPRRISVNDVHFNLTMRDGYIEGLSKDVVKATYRIEEKSNYNLVRNGGFENV